MKIGSHIHAHDRSIQKIFHKVQTYGERYWVRSWWQITASDSKSTHNHANLIPANCDVGSMGRKLMPRDVPGCQDETSRRNYVPKGLKI